MENKVCKQCNSQFEVTDEDLKFLDKVSPEFGGKKYSIPAPTLCQYCRLQRRLAFRNVRSLYRRKSDKSGMDMISLFAPNSPFKTYHLTEINSDDFEAMDYAQDYDLNRSFFEQFRELQLRVPRAHASVDLESMENAEFVNLAISLKNAYMSFGVVRDENVYYCDSFWDTRNCVDCFFGGSCENCYQVVDCNNVYQGYFCRNCNNCREIVFCMELEGCQNCFGSAGLRNKQYCFFNEQLSKDEYEKKMAEVRLNEEMIEEHEKKLREVYLSIPHKCNKNVNAEDSTGDFMVNVKNCRQSFDLNKAENCSYCNTLVNGPKDNMDVAFSADGIELGYESVITSIGSYLVRFSFLCFPGPKDLLYCDNCSNSSNLFGCVGLKNKQYCILNKQYTKDEYEELVPKIIEKMMEDGQWGEFFPMGLSPYAYNETTANEWYPLTKEEAVQLGANWQDDDFGMKFDGPFYEPKDIELYNPKKNPNAQVEIDECVQGVMQCRVSGKPYRIISQELAFYIEHGLPIPRLHPNERYKQRCGWRRERRLYKRQCMCGQITNDELHTSGYKRMTNNNTCEHEGRCANEFETTYAPERPEKVYCEECYRKSVI